MSDYTTDTPTVPVHATLYGVVVFDSSEVANNSINNFIVDLFYHLLSNTFTLLSVLNARSVRTLEHSRYINDKIIDPLFRPIIQQSANYTLWTAQSMRV